VSVADLAAATLSRMPVWGWRSKNLKKKIHNTLAAFSVDHLLTARLGSLSGGQLQRVLLAIAMTPAPQLLLLDEPDAGVDVSGQFLFYKLIKELREAHDIGIIIVTHDFHGMMAIADRVIVLNRSLIAEGKPDEVMENPRVKELFL
jgi:zinc transport system ATP-binding protein